MKLQQKHRKIMGVVWATRQLQVRGFRLRMDDGII